VSPAHFAILILAFKMEVSTSTSNII